MVEWTTFFHIQRAYDLLFRGTKGLTIEVMISHIYGTRNLSAICSLIINYIVWSILCCRIAHDDVIKWKNFPRYWPFVQGIQRSPVNSPHKGQWRRALMFSLINTRINGWVNNGEAGDLRRHHAHYDVTVMDILLPRVHCYGRHVL